MGHTEYAGGHAKVPVGVKILRAGAILPEYQTEGASGFDLHARLINDDGDLQSVRLFSGDTVMIATGLAFEVPAGYELQIRPRSGLAAKCSITVMNTPGTVDADYRGEVKVLLHNHGRGVFDVRHGDRIAQGVICPVFQADFRVAETLNETARGTGGFGSTGV